MTRFRVFEPAGVEGRSDRAVFVADRFAAFALVFPTVWLLVNRLFLAALACFGFGLALTLLLGRLDFGATGTTLVTLLLPGLLVALEGSRLRAWKLRRRGFRERAVVTAANGRDAEILYYAGEGAVAPEPEPERAVPPFGPFVPPVREDAPSADRT